MRYYLTPITLNTLQNAARLQDTRASPFTFVWHISSSFMPQLAEPLWSFQRLVSEFNNWYEALWHKKHEGYKHASVRWFIMVCYLILLLKTTFCYNYWVLAIKLCFIEGMWNKILAFPIHETNLYARTLSTKLACFKKHYASCTRS